MKKEDKKILAISIAMIALLALSSFFNLKRQTERDGGFFPEIKEFSFPEIDNSEIPNIKDIISGEALNEHLEIEESGDFIVRKIEDKFQFEIPSSWEELPLEIYHEHRHIMSISFSAISENKIDPLIINILKFNEESLDSALDRIKEIFTKESVDMVIVKSSEKDGFLDFSAEYKEDGNIYHSKEKIFNIHDDYYLFSIIGSAEVLSKDHDRIDFILRSIQIIE